MSAEKVFEAIKAERAYQDKKWGPDKPQSLAGYLLILESELAEAKIGWIKNRSGRNSTLSEIVQIAAVAIACLERYGIEGSAVPTDDEVAISVPINSDTRLEDKAAEAAFYKRFKADNCDDMNEEQWKAWVDVLPQDEFMAMLSLGMKDAKDPSEKNGG